MKAKNIIPAQAARLKKIRLYLAMTREQLGEAVGISQFTIRSWENGEKNFTAVGVQRIINALKAKINFSCPFDWLMYGTGHSPISLHEESLFRSPDEIRFDSCHEKLLKEVITFKQLNPLASIAVVSDDTFSPIAAVGDYIGLVSRDIANLDDYIGKIVFLSFKNGASEFGILDKKRHSYRVIPFNGSALSKLMVQHISNLQQFIWLRKIY
jgi:DNA-binding XRE family transcriptional regulator